MIKYSHLFPHEKVSLLPLGTLVQLESYTQYIQYERNRWCSDFKALNDPLPTFIIPLPKYFPNLVFNFVRLLLCCFIPDHLYWFDSHLNSAQLYRDTYRLIKSLSIRDAAYAVSAVVESQQLPGVLFLVRT